MRKILLITFISILAFGASAQIASPISLGVHAGWSSTKIKIENATMNDIKSSASGGYMFGIFGRVNLGKLYIQPELNYSKKIGTVDIKNAQTDLTKITSDLTYSSIDIPLLLGYKIIKLPFVNVHVFAGPVASFSTNALKLDNIKGATQEFINSVKDLDAKKTIWNVKFGGGVEVWKLNLDVDYEMGLRDFNKDINAPKIFNITLGLRII